jgi:hypothetical protein
MSPQIARAILRSCLCSIWITSSAHAQQSVWVTNAPAVFRISIPPTAAIIRTNSEGQVLRGPVSKLAPTTITNYVFDHFVPESLNNAVWTNILARTNGRSTVIWSRREHPPGWPARPPVVTWNSNCLMWGMKGLTGLSPCWSLEGSSGQIPITALTRRHGYTRGHSMGAEGFRTNYAGARVWFLTTDNRIVQMTVAREVVRCSPKGDYTILLFTRDLPESIVPLRVTTDLVSHYPSRPPAPCPLFYTEQLGNVSAQLPGFTVPTWKGGDSGSPNLLPLGNELIFFGGRSTSGPSLQMQTDMDELCRLQHIPPMPLQWVDLHQFPSW